jgi:hypothetical protein
MTCRPASYSTFVCRNSQVSFYCPLRSVTVLTASVLFILDTNWKQQNLGESRRALVNY